MMINFTNKIIRFFNVMVALIPLCMATILALVYVCGGWEKILEGCSPDFYRLETIKISWVGVVVVVIWIVLIIGIVLGFESVGRYIRGDRLRKILFCIAIFLLAFGVRFFLLYVFSEDLQPYSDFNAAWQRAIGNFAAGKMDYYSIFPAYLNFSLYENMVISIFGEKYVNILYLNAIYSGVTASLVYLISTEVMEQQWICVLAGVVYALYPSNILFAATGAPDFLAIVFNTMGVYVFFRAYKSNKTARKIFAVLLGSMLLGISGSFKTFSIITLLAFAMICVARYVLDRNKKDYSSIVILVIALGVSIAGYRGTSDWMLDATSKFYNMDLRTETAIPHYLLIGLNTEGEGQIGLGGLSRLYYKEYLENGMDYEAAKKYAYNLLLEDLTEHRNEIIPNLAKKMIWAWQDDYKPVMYFLEKVGLDPNSPLEIGLYKLIETQGAFFSEITYLLVVLMAAIGAIKYAMDKKINFTYEYIALVIFGYFCMVFLSEAQSRYKILVMPYIIILTCIGVASAVELVARMMHGNKSKREDKRA